MAHFSPNAMRGLLLAVPLLLGAASNSGGSVEVVVTGVRESRGVVRVGLCSEQTFLKKCAYVGSAPARQGTTIVTVVNVPAGRYAAQAYHDRNSNGKADRNFVGLPTEDVGFSNNALTHLAAPKFKDAAFDHGAGPQRITFVMKKLI